MYWNIFNTSPFWLHRRVIAPTTTCPVFFVAETATDPESMTKFSQRARKFGIISIVVWVSLLALIPVLMALFSYLATLKN
uniref:Uncharacterized protein n=1 Tax=Seriola lalandi dorsalis TaxID=1841481 RepID=A0A3B4Y1R8_SERLL